MHWIQTIREHLKISQKDLAGYLGLSPHMLQSVELERRRLPLTSLRPAMILYETIMTAQARSTGVDASPATGRDLRHTKRLHHQCRRKLSRCKQRLENMQGAYATASSCLRIYLDLARTLGDDDDPVCKTWIQRKIEETVQQVKDNEPAEQGLLTLEIAVLKGIACSLEEALAGEELNDPTT
jgi:transcriptional regulator with XRE-family HTH domain